MRVAIHQPHYFPWLGYFDKMAKVDAFILLDQVQFVKASQMVRNRIINPNGELQYLTIMADKRGYCDKMYSEISTVNNKEWKAKNLSLLRAWYRKGKGYNEMLQHMEQFFEQDFLTVCEWTIASINMIRELLDVRTPLILQSNVPYDHNNKKSDMDMELCKAVGADTYFSGRGASVEYLDREKFAENGVKIVFQDFTHPVYPQCNSNEFIPGISILDLLFNCGIEETRRIFWDNARSTHEFDEIEE